MLEQVFGLSSVRLVGTRLDHFVIKYITPEPENLEMQYAIQNVPKSTSDICWDDFFTISFCKHHLKAHAISLLIKRSSIHRTMNKDITSNAQLTTVFTDWHD